MCWLCLLSVVFSLLVTFVMFERGSGGMLFLVLNYCLVFLMFKEEIRCLSPPLDLSQGL